MGGGLAVAAGADGGLDHVHEHPQGERDVGGQDARRADRRGVLVGSLEITPPQRRYRPHMMSRRPA